MNISFKQISKIFLTIQLLISCSFFSVCIFANESMIWKADSNVFFKYSNQNKSGIDENDHPVELKEEEITSILELLKIKTNKNGNSEEILKPVFTAEQSKLLGQYLAKGLRNAKPRQDILFTLERSVRKSFGFKPDQYFVAGRAFYKDNKLNIIIGDYDRLRDSAYEAAVDPTQVGIVRYQFDHGNRSKQSKDFYKAVMNTAGIQRKQIDGTQRNDWLAIDIKEAIQANNQMILQKKQEEMAKKREDLRQILNSDVQTGVEKTKPVENIQPLEKSDHAEKIKGTVEERLTTLKRLREKELITDQEYQQKRKEILNSL